MSHADRIREHLEAHHGWAGLGDKDETELRDLHSADHDGLNERFAAHGLPIPHPWPPESYELPDHLFDHTWHMTCPKCGAQVQLTRKTYFSIDDDDSLYEAHPGEPHVWHVYCENDDELIDDLEADESAVVGIVRTLLAEMRAA